MIPDSDQQVHWLSIEIKTHYLDSVFGDSLNLTSTGVSRLNEYGSVLIKVVGPLVSCLSAVGGWRHL